MNKIFKRYYVIIIISMFIITFQLNTIADDWSTFHKDETRTGYTKGHAPITNNVAWKYNIGSPIVSSPTVSGDKVFVGADDAKLYAFNRTNGDLLWSYQTGKSKAKGIKSTPTVSNGLVIFGSLDNNLYALNEETGEVVWTHEFDNWMDTTPAVTSGIVFTEAWIIHSETDYEKIFCALYENNGEIKWKKELLSSIHSSPSVHNGVVYVGVGNNAPTIYTSWPGGLYAFNAENGDILWKFTAGDGVNNADVDTAPCIAYGKIYFGCNYGTIHSVYENNGTEAWQYKARFVKSSPAAYNDMIFIGSLDGLLYAFNSNNGDVIWTYETGDRIDSSPAIGNGIVYVGSDDNYIYALNATNGNLIWKYKTNGSIDSSPCISDGMLFIGSDDGYLYAFGENLPEDLPEKSDSNDNNVWIIALILTIIILILLIIFFITRLKNRNIETKTTSKVKTCNRCGQKLQYTESSKSWYCEKCQEFG